MSYFGIQEVVLGHAVTVKLHGPLDNIEIEPSKLRSFVRLHHQAFKAQLNVVEYANALSHNLVEKYCNGNTLVWAEVEIRSPNGLIYSSSAEKVSNG